MIFPLEKQWTIWVLCVKVLLNVIINVQHITCLYSNLSYNFLSFHQVNFQYLNFFLSFKYLTHEKEPNTVTLYMRTDADPNIIKSNKVKWMPFVHPRAHKITNRPTCVKTSKIDWTHFVFFAIISYFPNFIGTNSFL